MGTLATRGPVRRGRAALRGSLDALVELAGDVGIELRVGAALDLGDRDLVRERAAVGAVAGHRVVGVGDRDDARHERDVVALRAERIAAAVPALVVQVHARDERVQELDRVEDVAAVARVLLEDLVLVAA